jgi:hypothetical protein
MIWIIIILAEIIFCAFMWLVATNSNQPNEYSNQALRWLYALALFLLAGTIVYSIIPNFLGFAFGAGVGSAIVASRIKIIPSNISKIAQNTLWTQELSDGNKLRILFRGGTNVLLHFEKFVGTIKEDVQTSDLISDENVEGKDNNRYFVALYFDFIADPDMFQEIAELDHDEVTRIEQVLAKLTAKVKSKMSKVARQSSRDEMLNDYSNLAEKVLLEIGDWNYRGYYIDSITINDVSESKKIQVANEDRGAFERFRGKDNDKLSPEELEQAMIITGRKKANKIEVEISDKTSGGLSKGAKEHIGAEAMEFHNKGGVK